LPGDHEAICARGLVAGYGTHVVLQEASISVGEGDIVSVVGHNGAGKSTLLKCLFGLLPAQCGEVEVRGTPVRAPTPARMLSLGVALAPQGNRVLSDLTVEEHLRLATSSISERTARQHAQEQALAEFPVLKERRRQKAGTLSGGEKQMLVIAASLASSPRVLLLDEPTLGLAPSARQQLFRKILTLREERRLSLLIVEQRVQEIIAVADRICVLKRGRIALDSSTADVRLDPAILTTAFL